jgi:acyl-CoA oxidase
MNVSDSHDLDFKQIRERTMLKVARMAQYLSREPLDVFRKRMEILSMVDPAAWTRIGVHFGLFLNALRGQATPAQLSYWVNKGLLSCHGLIGCFAMTELGHGSNVAGLETTCTLDEASDEFIVHTPSLTGIFLFYLFILNSYEMVDWWCCSNSYSCCRLCSMHCQGKILWRQMLCCSTKKSS